MSKNQSRQKLFRPANFGEAAEGAEKSIKVYQKFLTEGGLTLKAKTNFFWIISLEKIESLILKYTINFPIDSLQKDLPDVIDSFNDFINNEIEYRKSEASSQFAASALEITQLEAYVLIFWLLAICKLCNHDSHIPIIISWLNKETAFNRGRDTLLENVIHALTQDCVPAEQLLLHPTPYRSLCRATVSPTEQRSDLVKQFLDDWYKGMKPCYWYGTHTNKKNSGFFGYWAFEAALVTILWDIDDSSYRDHLVYPKDLVDWYRSNSNK